MNGVLPLDKPAGITSHDVVARVRRALGLRPVGHTGTLDPFATGLMLVCVGPATRLAEYLTGLYKVYQATLRLGAATDTDDLTGTVLFTSDSWRELDEARLRAAFAAQVGRILQVPPRYSAKKVAGERMYAAARRGEEIERAPVPVIIHSAEATDIRLPDVEFAVACGSGTYIRAIARDVGEMLGVGAHLTALRRTRVGDFVVQAALTLDELDDPARVRERLLTPAGALAHLATVRVGAAEREALRHGRAVTVSAEAPAGEPLVLVDDAGELLAVGAREGGVIRPRKVFLA